MFFFGPCLFLNCFTFFFQSIIEKLRGNFFAASLSIILYWTKDLNICRYWLGATMSLWGAIFKQISSKAFLSKSVNENWSMLRYILRLQWSLQSIYRDGFLKTPLIFVRLSWNHNESYFLANWHISGREPVKNPKLFVVTTLIYIYLYTQYTYNKNKHTVLTKFEIHNVKTKTTLWQHKITKEKRVPFYMTCMRFLNPLLHLQEIHWNY